MMSGVTSIYWNWDSGLSRFRVTWSAVAGWWFSREGKIAFWGITDIFERLGREWASQVVLMVKKPPANAGRGTRNRFDSWVGKIPWRKGWQSTPAFLLGASHRQRKLVGQSTGSQSWTQLKWLSVHTLAGNGSAFTRNLSYSMFGEKLTVKFFYH